MPKFELKKIFPFIIIIPILIFTLFLGNSLFSTVEKGSYQIKQAAISGNMSAKMSPGLWLKLFGSTQTWQKAETFYFTADSREGNRSDDSIEVRFNDGSICNISGTLRIVMPTDPNSAMELVTVQGYQSYPDLERKLVLPVVRNALRLTANLMSARESYTENRSDFIFWAWDQIQNGLYETTEEIRKVKDPVSGELVTRTFKIIKRKKDGSPLYQRNPLENLGLKLANFEIKSFVYAEKVRLQIAKQQEALMAVETARAKAKEAEQSALTSEAEGKAKVMKAKYEEEEKKVKSLVEALKNKEVAELEAKKELEVAKLNKQSAEFKKQAEILLGQGEAERKKLVMEADGALKQKLDTYETVMATFAKEFSKQKWVPEISMGGNISNSKSNSASELIDLLTIKTAKDLGLDLGIKNSKRK